MNRIKTNINPKSSEFKANHAHMRQLVAELESQLERVRNAGGEKGIQKFRERGKLLPRERLELLLDPGTAFLELMPLAALDVYNNEAPGAGQITGIGTVSGRECMIFVNDATVKGGAMYPITLEKTLRAQDIAEENRLPCIMLVESGGANLLYQAEVFPNSNGFGRIFANMARLSAQGIPQISLVFGSSTAGGAYFPGMSDYVVMVREKARVYLGGPPLVKMATGEDAEEESLGGAEMHSTISGVSDFIAEDDAHAVQLGRQIAENFHFQKPISRKASPEAPCYDPDEILGILPMQERSPFDMREIIARIVDGSRFFEFKPDYGTTLVTGNAYIDGYPVGILGNNGILFSEAANKATQFIQLANQSRTPLIYLQNITGFMVGTQYEQGGIIKHGSQMVNAVATSTVPQFTVIVGGSYGAGNYAMCGRAYDPRLLLTYPNSRIAVMGGDQAAGVMRLIQEAQATRRGQEPDQEKIDRLYQSMIEQFSKESSPYYATARLWDDGIIDPRDTRQALSMGLSIAHNVDFVTQGLPNYGVFRM